MRSKSIIEDDADHPTRERLAALLQDGFSPEEAERIMRHLDGCPECTVRMDDIEPWSALCRQYQSALRIAEAGPWKDIRAEMRRLDAERGIVSFPTVQKRPAWRVMMGAIAAGLIFTALLLWPTGRGAEARAEVLLAKACQLTPVTTPKTHLRVRTANASFVRPMVRHAQSPDDDAIRAEFVNARYDWDDPLSASAYTQWRDGLKNRTAKVTEDGKKSVIDTTTSDGGLIEASLTIETASNAVTAGTFRFLDHGWLEITVEPDSPADGVLESRAVVANPRIRPDGPPSTAEEKPLPQREIEVWAAIDSLDAGAGAPIGVEVESGGRIVVTGYRMSPDLEDKLRSSLDRVPLVTVRSEGAVTPESADPRQSGEPAINLSESIASRAHLLDQLAVRFPPQLEATLPLPDRNTLHGIRLKQATQMNRDIEALCRQVGKGAIPNGAGVQDLSTGALVRSASEVDRLVTANYTGASGGNAASAELSVALAQLQDLAQFYRRSLEAAQ